jgi:hypothetical protein
MLVSRRRTLRIACHLRAVWMQQRAAIAVATDRSANGMFLAGCVGVARGSELDVAVRLDDVSVACTARVQFMGDSRRGHGAGIEIVEMLDVDRARWLAEYRRAVEHAITRAPVSIGDYLRRRSRLDAAGARGER